VLLEMCQSLLRLLTDERHGSSILICGQQVFTLEENRRKAEKKLKSSGMRS
jgi:hypothetical protein